MAHSPLKEDTTLVTFEILSNGSSIRDSVEIISMDTFHSANAIDEAVITLNDGGRFNDNFENLDAKDFNLDNKIEIKLGYHSKNATVFKGKIIRKSVIVNSVTSALSQVICEDHGHDNLSKRQLHSDDSKPPVLELTYGRDIIEAQLDLDKDSPETAHGYLKFQGFANIKLNDYVSIKGFGKTFPERALVSGVEHKVEDGNWHTTAYIGYQS